MVVEEFEESWPDTYATKGSKKKRLTPGKARQVNFFSAVLMRVKYYESNMKRSKLRNNEVNCSCEVEYREWYKPAKAQGI